MQYKLQPLPLSNLLKKRQNKYKTCQHKNENSEQADPKFRERTRERESNREGERKKVYERVCEREREKEGEGEKSQRDTDREREREREREISVPWPRPAAWRARGAIIASRAHLHAI